jgi:hypothetical protein
MLCRDRVVGTFFLLLMFLREVLIVLSTKMGNDFLLPLELIVWVSVRLIVVLMKI